MAFLQEASEVKFYLRSSPSSDNEGVQITEVQISKDSLHVIDGHVYNKIVMMNKSDYED